MKKLWCAVVLFCWLLPAVSGFAGTLVTFQIFFGVNQYLGNVDVELYDQDKPVTTRNFINLIQAGAYGNSFFHRCVPGFVVQGGGFAAVAPFATNIIVPPFTNLVNVPNFGNITNEFKVGKFYSNTNWTIAMAKTSDPNSANSQFFFNLANNAAALDDTNNSGGFTVFGHVLRGTNVLNDFNTISYGAGLIDLSKNYGASGSVFSQLPEDLAGTNPPPYFDLVYFNVSILTAQVKAQPNGARQISWNSVSGLTNNVEYATNLPPVWQVLTSIVGNGGPTNVIDSATSKTRFYRVHVLY
jgi:cyclophilin family peptidyl-prolyl cis-trans isomerase